MPSAADLTIEKRFLGLFVGDSGSGKTPSACSFVDSHPTKKVYVFDFDGRMETLLNTPWIDRTRIDYDYYPPITNNKKEVMKPNWDLIATKLEAIWFDCERFKCEYNTIILDSLKSQTFSFFNDSKRMTAPDPRKFFIKGGMADYGNESDNTQTLIANLRALPIQNIIVTSHLVDKYEKEDKKNPFSNNIVCGSRLALRDKLAATLVGDFNHVFEFDRRFYDKNYIKVKFWSDIARSVYPNLPTDEIDITGKSFYKVLHSYAKKEMDSSEQKEAK